MDFFTAPSRMKEALDGPLVALMRKAYGAGERIGFDLVGRWAATVFRAMARITGAELIDEMMAFIDALSDLFGSFSDRATEVERTLRSDQVGFVLVTTADRATLREAREFRQRLSSLGMTVDAVVFNRVCWPAVPEPPVLDNPGDQAEIERLNAAWNRNHERAVRLVSGVSSAWGGLKTVSVVPVLAGDADRIDSLSAIADYL